MSFLPSHVVLSEFSSTVNLSMFASLKRTRTSLSFESQIPRLMVPSIGGGTKRGEIFRAGADDIGGGEGEGVSIGDGEGVGDSCPNAVALSNKIAIRNLSIISPVKIREKIVARFAIGEE